jgi:hypothetical protein
MLEELRRIASTEPYKSRGGMLVKEVQIIPPNEQARLIFELFEDDDVDAPRQLWEIECNGLGLDTYRHLPDVLIPTSQIKVFDNHPLLWCYADEIFFSITSTTTHISSLIGDLFIEHEKACGNWIHFDSLYGGLPETLLSMRQNQLAIPAPLKNACFSVLDRYGIGYAVNGVEAGEKGYSVMFFSNATTWPDEQNFSQAYVVAKNFSERRLI